MPATGVPVSTAGCFVSATRRTPELLRLLSSNTLDRLALLPKSVEQCLHHLLLPGILALTLLQHLCHH